MVVVIPGGLFYDPYGRTTKLQGSLDSDIQYGGYYHHGPFRIELGCASCIQSDFWKMAKSEIPIEDFALGPLLASALQANQLASVGRQNCWTVQIYTAMFRTGQ